MGLHRRSTTPAPTSVWHWPCPALNAPSSLGNLLCLDGKGLPLSRPLQAGHGTAPRRGPGRLVLPRLLSQPGKHMGRWSYQRSSRQTSFHSLALLSTPASHLLTRLGSLQPHRFCESLTSSSECLLYLRRSQ